MKGKVTTTQSLYKLEAVWLAPPAFMPGDAVYALFRVRGTVCVRQDVVRSVRTQVHLARRDVPSLGLRKGAYYLVASSYDLERSLGIDRGDGSFDACDLFFERTSAIAAAHFFQVKLSDEQWLQAIGDRAGGFGGDGSIQESDLGVCCAEISNARDLLLRAREYNGLCRFDRDVLRDLLQGHGFKLRPRSPLSKVLRQLGIRLTNKKGSHCRG